ncbi:MAG: winged helix-turn-helix transcriptional regulator [Thermoplasmatota archaeon]
MAITERTEAGILADNLAYMQQPIMSMPAAETWHANSSEMRLASTGDWGAILIANDHLVNATNVKVASTAGRGEGCQNGLARPPYPQWAEEPVPFQRSICYVYVGAESITAQGSFTLELFGVTGHSSQGDSSFSSGYEDEVRAPYGGGAAFVRYAKLDVTDGWLSLTAAGATGLTFGANATIDLITGRATLPLAKGTENANHASWHIEAPARLAGIEPGADESFTARAHFCTGSLRVDGNFEEPLPTGAITASSLGLVATVLLAIKAFPTAAALLTRLPPEKALENANRKALYAYILDHPGATFREVLRGTGIPAGTARHHLSVLCRSNMIVEHGHRSTLRFFENHGRFDATWQSIVLLREHPLSKVYQWLKDHPGSIQRELLEHAEAKWQWSRSTTQHRLARLIDGGLVDVQHMGRRKMYEVVDPRNAEPIPLKSSWT